MTTDSGSIVLAPVDGATPNLSTSVSQEALYDTSVKYLYELNGGASTPTFSVMSIISDFVKDMESVRRITLPINLAVTGNRRGNGSTHVAALWETRDTSHRDRPWTVIVGTARGRRQTASNILNTRLDLSDKSVRDPKPYIGRRALVTLSEGSLVTMGMTLRNKTYILTYEVTSIHPWSETKTDFVPSKRVKLAAANLKLISVLASSKFAKDEFWEDTVAVTPNRRDGIDAMRTAVYANLTNPVWTLSYCEHFKAGAVAKKGAKGIKHRPDDSEDMSLSRVLNPEEFMNELTYRISAYQIALKNNGFETDARLIPAHVQYTPVYAEDEPEEGEDTREPIGLELLVEVPTILDPEIASSFGVTCIIEGTIPATLKDEKMLVHSMPTYSKLLATVKRGGTDKSVFIRI